MRRIILIIALTIFLNSVTSVQAYREFSQDAKTLLIILDKKKLSKEIEKQRKIIQSDPGNRTARNYALLGYFYLHKKNQLNKAIDAYKNAIELDPDYLSARYFLGVAYTNAGNYDEAITEYEKALKLSPDDPAIFTELGVTYRRKGLTEEAVKYIKKALVLDPYEINARLNLAKHYVASEKWPEAIDELLHIRDLDEWYPGVEELLGLTLEKALPNLKKWAEEKPEDPSIHYYLSYAIAYSNSSEQRWKKALKEINKAIELDKTKSEYYKALALFYSSDSKSKKSIKALKKCIDLEPSNWACIYRLGLGYAEINKPEKSMDALKNGEKINPSVINIQHNLGAGYYNFSDAEKASAAFKKALLLGSKNPYTHLYLAFAYYELKQYPLAWIHARIAEKMGLKEPALIEDLRTVSEEPK